MSSGGYKIRNQQAVHFLTFAVVEWVDVFTRREYAYLVVESLNYCVREKGLLVHAWCLMPNHLHLIVLVKEGAELSAVIRDFKKFTSSRILQAIEENRQESRRNWMLWIFQAAGEKEEPKIPVLAAGQPAEGVGFQFFQGGKAAIRAPQPGGGRDSLGAGALCLLECH